MKSKIIGAIAAAPFVLGILALSGCYDASYPGYGYGGGGYYSSGPAVVGDWDEHRTWHDRDWWVNNRRDWVTTHHKEWIANDHSHDREVHASADRSRDVR